MKQASSSQGSQILLDIESIGKKIGKLEVTTSHLQKQIGIEGVNRSYVDSRSDELSLIFQREINALKKGFDQLALLLTESVEDIKTNLGEDMEFKTNTISKLVEASLERLDSIEQATINQNNDQMTQTRNIDLKLKQFNNHLSNELKQFSTTLNTAMTKIAFCEKQMNEQSSSLSTKVNLLSNDVKEIKKVLDTLVIYKDSSNKSIEHLQTENASSQEINSKFHYQTSVIIEEVKGKMKKTDSIMKNHLSSFEAIRKEVYAEISNMKGIVNSNLNKMHLEIEDKSSEMKNDIKEFQKKITDLNISTEKFVHKHIEELSIEIKTLFETNSTELVKLNDRHMLFEEKVLIKQNDFFDNLNEIEEYMNKKYESVMRVMNQAPFNSKC